jgi:UDP-glucose 4-epimerase
MAKATTEADVFNVCTGKPSSLLDLIAALSDAGGRELKVETGPARVGDIRESFGDASKTTGAFGMTADMSLRDGLAKTLESLNA